VERADAEIAGDFSLGDLEGLHVPKDEQSLVNGVSWALALLMGMLLQDRDLHFKLVDPVFEKEDLLGLRVNVSADQSFEAAPAHPSRETSREQGGSDEQRDSGIEDVEILCHGASSRAPRNDAAGANSSDSIASNGGRKPARRQGA